MKAIDLLVHMSTKKGHAYRNSEDVAAAERYYKRKLEYKTEEEMAQDLRDADVKAILSLPMPKASIEEVMVTNDYIAQVVRDYPDTYLGAWAFIDPRSGSKGVKELERCLKDLGFVGFETLGTQFGIPPTDKLYYPFYQLCRQANVPVMIHVGMCGIGAGWPGGQGYYLEYARPIYVDFVAADFPDLTIIAARPAWPWQDEMIAILLHKSNVYNDLHGWAPKYLTPELKREINGRLQDRFLFGSAYPMVDHKRLFGEWESEGYKPEVLEKLYLKNAQSVLGLKV
jgi:predicted TIM-barrel fold metal-dependent hydrolase